MSTLTLPELLWRNTVGFDHLKKLLDVQPNNPKYPPHNILKTGPETFRIVMAVAGFSEKEISIVVEKGLLIVSGQQEQESSDYPVQLIYQGIAARDFQSQFTLGDWVQVVSASLNNGLLLIDLERQLPEEQKPKIIPIGHSITATDTFQSKNN